MTFFLKSLTMDKKREMHRDYITVMHLDGYRHKEAATFLKFHFMETMAFEKARTKFNVPGAKLVLITEEYYDAALEFAKEYFIPYEPIYKSLGVPWNEEIEEFRLESLKLNLSLMIINEESGEPMALRTIRIARYDDKVDLESIQTQPFKELIRYSDFCDEQADFFGYFGTTEAFHFLGLAVADKYKQRGLATHIVNAAIDMIRNFGIEPVYIKAEGSSNFSKKIFENATFEILFEQPFATWEVEGKLPIQNTGIHKSQKVYGKKLTAES